MIIDKYIFCMPKAVRFVCQRYGIRKLTSSELFLLYASKRLRVHTNAAFYRLGERFGHPINETTILDGLKMLKSMELLNPNNTLTTLGREILAGIRSYLVNVRL